MGIQLYVSTNKMMKSIFFACLLAAVYAEAEPKADADAYYGLGYSGVVPGYTGLNRHFIGKREAEAEPEAEADADAYYGYGYNNLGYGYNNLGYGYAARSYAAAPVATVARTYAAAPVATVARSYS